MNRLITGLLLIACGQLSAQHLQAYRNSNLRVTHQTGAEPIPGAGFAAGELLELLDSGKQINGYYHASIPGINVDGWVYRSLVRKMDGQLPTFQQDYIGADVYIVDVGAGLGCIIKTPSGKYIIYDGGNSDYVNRFLNGLHEKGGEIELVIVSHTDSDHWRSIDEIVEDYMVKKALYTSYRPDGLKSTITKGIEALKKENGILKVHDLADKTIPADSVIYREGDFSLTFLSGFGQRDSVFADDIGKDASKLRNAASIVVKLEYMGRSVLFTGDIKGMKDCDKDECDCEMKCISTEKYLVGLDSAGTVLLDSDVILAPHHGARNASCPDFINAVSPEYVIFSAGNTHKHPHHLTATNYLNYGVPLQNIYRTDIGKTPPDDDDNECNNEWIGGNRYEKEADVSFDDHIRIQITDQGRLFVGNLKD